MLNSKLILVLFLFCFSCGSIEKCQDTKACDEFNMNLKIIENSLELNKNFDGEELEKARFFMEEVTSIESESDLGLEGAYPPTKEDYLKWKTWYKKYKSQLKWNETEEKVYVNK